MITVAVVMCTDSQSSGFPDKLQKFLVDLHAKRNVNSLDISPGLALSTHSQEFSAIQIDEEHFSCSIELANPYRYGFRVLTNMKGWCTNSFILPVLSWEVHLGLLLLPSDDDGQGTAVEVAGAIFRSTGPYRVNWKRSQTTLGVSCSTGTWLSSVEIYAVFSSGTVLVEPSTNSAKVHINCILMANDLHERSLDWFDLVNVQNIDDQFSSHECVYFLTCNNLPPPTPDKRSMVAHWSSFDVVLPQVGQAETQTRISRRYWHLAIEPLHTSGFLN